MEALPFPDPPPSAAIAFAEEGRPSSHGSHGPGQPMVALPPFSVAAVSKLPCMCESEVGGEVVVVGSGGGVGEKKRWNQGGDVA